MGLFRKKKDLTTGGVPATAVILSDERLDLDTDDSGLSLTDFGLGSHKFKFELEVTVDGRAPYTVVGKFKAPAKVGGEAGPGVRLPAFVDPDDPNRVVIDWDGFLAEGGADAFKAAHQRKREAQVREITGLPEPEPDYEPPINASPRETLDWQLAKGILDQATYDAIIANNRNLK